MAIHTLAFGTNNRSYWLNVPLAALLTGCG
jgi:hypothetical protein